MSSKIEHEVDTYIKVRKNIVLILNDAGSCERFLSKPNNNRVPSMYQLLEDHVGYDKKDWGYHIAPKLKLRATPRQLTNYSTAIDLLLMIDESISEDPTLMRKILWLRATRNSYTAIGKYLIYHRTTIKRMYDTVLDKLTNKIIKESLDIYDKKFSY
tara:strand:+ start:250 stop:720 length:471 start_codon:yes stop_codon:yes gene_type:complete